MAEIYSIKRMRQSRDPDVFINEVLNDPARIERLREKREKRLEDERKELERQEREKAQQEEFNSFVLKLAVGFSFLMTIVATYVALAF